MITSKSPLRSGGNASNQSPCLISIRVAGRPRPAAFARAAATASTLRSVQITCTVLCSAASDSPMQPLPVPRSAASGSRPSDAARLTSANANSATPSVSGRGINTRASTAKSSVRKPHRPSTYCRGSPPSRRSSIASKWATPRFKAGRSRTRANSPGSAPEASSTMHRASTAANSSPTASSRPRASL